MKHKRSHKNQHSHKKNQQRQNYNKKRLNKENFITDSLYKDEPNQNILNEVNSNKKNPSKEKTKNAAPKQPYIISPTIKTTNPASEKAPTDYVKPSSPAEVVEFSSDAPKQIKLPVIYRRLSPTTFRPIE